MQDIKEIKRLIDEYEEIIKQVKIEAEDKVNKYRDFIIAMKKLPEYQNIEPNSPSPLRLSKSTTAVIRKTLNQKVKEIFQDKQYPMTSRELMEQVNERFLDKIYEFNSWSGTFSQMYTKPNSGIAKFYIGNQQPQFSTFYGLEEWFNGKNLKEDYKRKISDHYGLDFSLFD